MIIIKGPTSTQKSRSGEHRELHNGENFHNFLPHLMTFSQFLRLYSVEQDDDFNDELVQRGFEALVHCCLE
jgi:hypothetical protein